MESIKESIKCLLDAEKSRLKVNEFARIEYDKKFENVKIELNSYHTYTGFDVVSENEIKVNFEYGSGEMEFYGSFNVKL